MSSCALGWWVLRGGDRSRAGRVLGLLSGDPDLMTAGDSSPPTLCTQVLSPRFRCPLSARLALLTLTS